MSKCPYCHRALFSDAYGPLGRPSRDHVLPRARGGGDAEDNLRIVHDFCNCMRAEARECVGAMACGLAVAADNLANARHVLRNWFSHVIVD